MTRFDVVFRLCETGWKPVDSERQGASRRWLLEKRGRNPRLAPCGSRLSIKPTACPVLTDWKTVRPKLISERGPQDAGLGVHHSESDGYYNRKRLASDSGWCDINTPLDKVQI